MQGAYAVSAVSESTCRHCVAGVQAVKAVLEPTCPALCCRATGCLSSVRTYMPGIVLQGCRPGTVLQGCRLFKGCRNLPARHCVQGCRLFKQCRNYLPGTVLQGCKLFKQCRNLPARHCVAGVQAV